MLDFFTTSTGNLLAAEKTGGVGHHVALCVVGTERLSESGYFRAKMAQETLIRESGIPYKRRFETMPWQTERSYVAALVSLSPD